MPTAAASSPNSEMMMGKPTSTQLVKVITLMNTRRGAWMPSRPAIQMPSARLIKMVIMGSGRHTTISPQLLPGAHLGEHVVQHIKGHQHIYNELESSPVPLLFRNQSLPASHAPMSMRISMEITD